MKSLRGNPAQRQRGAAGLLLIVLFGALVLIVLNGPLTTDLEDRLARSQEIENAYMDDLASRLESWYDRNAATIDASTTYSVTPAALWAELGVEPKVNLQLGISDRIAGAQVAYRRVVIWLQQSSPDASSFVQATGAFTPGPGSNHRVIDGQRIQTVKLEQTLGGMKRFAFLLERRFQAKFEADPLRSLSVNHFRPVSGTCATSLDDLPCINTYTTSSVAANFQTILGVDPSTLVSAWGQPYEVSNQEDSRTTSPPYTMAIRAVTPWGSPVLVNAIQPLN